MSIYERRQSKTGSSKEIVVECKYKFKSSLSAEKKKKKIRQPYDCDQL